MRQLSKCCPSSVQAGGVLFSRENAHETAKKYRKSPRYSRKSETTPTGSHTCNSPNKAATLRFNNGKRDGAFGDRPNNQKGCKKVLFLRASNGPFRNSSNGYFCAWPCLLCWTQCIKVAEKQVSIYGQDCRQTACGAHAMAACWTRVNISTRPGPGTQGSNKNDGDFW